MLSDEDELAERQRTEARRQRAQSMLDEVRLKAEDTANRSLIVAVDRGDSLEVARLLREEKSTRANYVGFRGNSLLHHAGRENIARMMFANGADVNVKNCAKVSSEKIGGNISSGGNTPLHICNIFVYLYSTIVF